MPGAYAQITLVALARDPPFANVDDAGRYGPGDSVGRGFRLGSSEDSRPLFERCPIGRQGMPAVSGKQQTPACPNVFCHQSVTWLVGTCIRNPPSGGVRGI